MAERPKQNATGQVMFIAGPSPQQVQPSAIERSPLAVNGICEAMTLPCMGNPAKKVTIIRATHKRRKENRIMISDISIDPTRFNRSRSIPLRPNAVPEHNSVLIEFPTEHQTSRAN